MTIRRTLLLAFLLVSFLPSILLTALTFRVVGEDMRSEIRQNLQVQATTVSQDIDKMLFERLQNAQTWRQTEVMQDIKIKDVDKRLSNFLADLKTGYQDVYTELFCTDATGKVVASSTPSHIGNVIAPTENILLEETRDASIQLQPFQISPTDGSTVLPIVANIPSKFDDRPLGNMYLMFNWSQISRILDQAAQSGHSLAVLDHDDRIIAASSDLRKLGVLLKQVPRDWIPAHGHGISTHDGAPLHLGEIMVGFDHAPGFQKFPGFNWTTLTIDSSQRAFTPVRQMAIVFLLLLAATSIFAIVFSMMIAGHIARPIANLTEFTRRFMHDKKLPELPNKTSGEVGELTETFVQTIRELDQSRADLVRASKLAVLGELAAVMAHEIRTPVGILRSSAQMLAREPNLSDEAQELTSFIESETERLNRLVTTLLDSARPRAPALKPTDINAIIRHVCGLMSSEAEKKGVIIKQDLIVPLAKIEADGELLTQMLLNLLMNAIQILPQGGEVLVTSQSTPESILMAVSDNGPGIPADACARVFDPFFTKRDGGVGLGLAVVQQIVTAHGGHICASNGPQGGAVFTITLPTKEQI